MQREQKYHGRQQQRTFGRVGCVDTSGTLRNRSGSKDILSCSLGNIILVEAVGDSKDRWGVGLLSDVVHKIHETFDAV
jgi:hypothetical protein